MRTHMQHARVPLESLGLDMCMHAYVQSSTSHFHLLLFNLLYVVGYPFQLSRLCTPISIENVELSILLVVRIEDGGEDASPKSSVSKRSSASQ